MKNKKSIPFLTLQQAAKFLKVSRFTLHIWLKAGLAPTYITIGKRKFFNVSDLKAFKKP